MRACAHFWHERLLGLLPLLLQHLHLRENTVSGGLELPLLGLNLLHLVHELVDLIVDAWRERLRNLILGGDFERSIPILGQF